MSNPKPYGVNELREMFLSFFESKNHLRLPSSRVFFIPVFFVAKNQFFFQKRSLFHLLIYIMEKGLLPSEVY